MKLSELIEALEEVKQQEGDVEIVIGAWVDDMEVIAIADRPLFWEADQCNGGLFVWGMGST